MPYQFWWKSESLHVHGLYASNFGTYDEQACELHVKCTHQFPTCIWYSHWLTREDGSCCVLISNGQKCFRKCPAAPNLWKINVTYWCEMARNAVEHHFRVSILWKSSVVIWNGEKYDRTKLLSIENEMATGNHFEFCLQQMKVTWS